MKRLKSYFEKYSDYAELAVLLLSLAIYGPWVIVTALAIALLAKGG